MATMGRKTIFVGFILVALCKIGQCQMNGMMNMMNMIPTMINGMRESQARAQLAPIVKYVVGETATPSPEMVNFAVIAGSAPVTQAEKDAYLEMMKKVARRTPAVVVKFVKIAKNGTYSLDKFKLDAHVTKRAMQYAAASKAKKERKVQEKQRQRKQEMDMIRMMQDHELGLLGALGQGMNTGNAGVMTHQPDVGFAGMDPGAGYDVFGLGVTPAADFGAFNPQVVASNHPVPANNQTKSGPASNAVSSGSISLLDVLRNNNQNNQGSGASSVVTNEVTQQVPAPAAHMPAGDPGMMNFMMLNGGMDMGLGF